MLLSGGNALRCVSCFIRAPPAGSGVESSGTVALEGPWQGRFGYILYRVWRELQLHTCQMVFHRVAMLFPCLLITLAGGPTSARPTTMQYPGLPRRDPTAPGLFPASFLYTTTLVRKAPRPVVITIPRSILFASSILVLLFFFLLLESNSCTRYWTKRNKLSRTAE